MLVLHTSSYTASTTTFYCLQVIAATNRADILDPALMRSGRLDRKIEFPHPTEDARAKILQVCLVVYTCVSYGFAVAVANCCGQLLWLLL